MMHGAASVPGHLPNAGRIGWKQFAHMLRAADGT
jgi:hypothetical protein